MRTRNKGSVFVKIIICVVLFLIAALVMINTINTELNVGKEAYYAVMVVDDQGHLMTSIGSINAEKKEVVLIKDSGTVETDAYSHGERFAIVKYRDEKIEIAIPAGSTLETFPAREEISFTDTEHETISEEKDFPLAIFLVLIVIAAILGIVFFRSIANEKKRRKENDVFTMTLFRDGTPKDKN